MTNWHTISVTPIPAQIKKSVFMGVSSGQQVESEGYSPDRGIVSPNSGEFYLLLTLSDESRRRKRIEDKDLGRSQKGMREDKPSRFASTFHEPQRGGSRQPGASPR